MIPSRLTIQELFEKTIQYTVPLYQRSYVWNREQQWEPLWEDIREKAERIEQQLQTSPHFLGAVVLNQVKTFGNELAKKQVIDGQQRLTTLQIFLAALRDHVEAFAVQVAPTDPDLHTSLEDLAHSLGALTRNRGVMAQPKVECHKLWPTNFDQDVFAAVMGAKSLDAVNARFPIVRLPRKRSPEPGPALVEAYRFFYRCVADLTALPRPASPILSYQSLMALYSTLQRGFHIIVIELESDDDPQVIFETLNARGVPLLASDLIRNHIFGRASAQAHDTNALYKTFWAAYDETTPGAPHGFWKENVKQGRLKRPRLDMFFQHYLAARSDQEVLPSHVFQSFRAWWDSVHPERDVLSELSILQQFGDVFRSLMEPARLYPSEPALSRTLARLRALDTHTAYPLLLWMLAQAKDQIPPHERDAMLTHLESFLVRHWIVGSSTKNYNKLFSQILRELRKKEPPTADDLQRLLLNISGENAWPDNKTFHAAWLSDPAYHRLGSHGVQMMLGTIHERMMTTKQEGVVIQGALTVEHVMPQSWAEHWPLPPSSADNPTSPDPSPSATRDALIQTFGNLTLLTQPLNASVSNGPFEAKRAAILSQSLLRLNTHFLHTDTWDEHAIRQRGETLFALALQLWPYPAPPL